MGYRDQCLQRLEAARSEMDRALASATNGAVLLQQWQQTIAGLEAEVPPEDDRMWLADRLDDLRVYVHNSPRWQELMDV